MGRIARLALASGLSVVAVAASLAAGGGPAFADTIRKSAHLGVENLGDDLGNSYTTLTVDVERVDGGRGVIDVEWSTYNCADTPDGGRVCDYVGRTAYDAPTGAYRWAPDAVSVQARVSYTETRFTCTTTPEPVESCGERVTTSGRGEVAVTLTATSEPERSVYVDENGIRHVFHTAWAVGGGTAFGTTFDPSRTTVATITKVRDVTP